MDDALPPVAGLPERLDRRLRLGPFPSGRDALKFVTYAAAGALVIPVAGAVAWLPVLCAAFAVSVWRPDGEALDERLVAVVRWRWRDLRQEGSVTGRPGARDPRGAVVRLSSARRAAVVRMGGIPLAYLPPTELARRFELYRTLLRTVEGGFLLRAAPAPIHARSFVPGGAAPAGAERAAWAGYRELVDLIARRRLVRHVYLAVATAEPGADGLLRLESDLAALADRLTALGLRPVRLRDRALHDAVRRIALAESGGAS
jgi:hypothetical protein